MKTGSAPLRAVIPILVTFLEPVASNAANPAPNVVTGTADVPIELYRDEILVEVRLQDRGPYLAVLDTGTDPSALDLETAKILGLTLPATFWSRGTGHDDARWSGSIGNAALRDLIVTIDYPGGGCS